MYIDTSHITRGDKTYTRHLLRESYRANGKVLHRTIANLSHCSAAEIEAMRLALRHKEELEHLGTVTDALTLKQGLSFGAVWTVYHIARRLGIEQALGTTREGKLALWQVIARVLDQGSRLSAVRLAMSHAACDVLGLGTFDEDALYENLDWLAHRQAAIENTLFAKRNRTKPVSLFLYDVTSSYLEISYAPDGARRRRGTEAPHLSYMLAILKVTTFSDVTCGFLFLGRHAKRTCRIWLQS
jgi:hypothetical protein